MCKTTLTKRNFLKSATCLACSSGLGLSASPGWAEEEGETKFCGVFYPTANEEKDALSQIAQENSEIVAVSSEEAAAMRIHPKWGRWNPKRISTNKPLRVGFLDPGHNMKKIVIAAGREWEKHMGLRFNFEASDDFDILVKFDAAGNNSYLGAASRHKAKAGLPSLNLQRFTGFNNQRQKFGIALHELGHALGLIHEHQNPAGNLNLDEEAVIAYYWAEYGWDEKKTKTNVLDPYTSAQVDEMTGFDPNSIMMYKLPSRLFADNSAGFSKNYVLSKNDTRLIGRIYPKGT